MERNFIKNIKKYECLNENKKEQLTNDAKLMINLNEDLRKEENRRMNSRLMKFQLTSD